MARPRRSLGAARLLFHLIIIALFGACSAAAADVAPEDSAPMTGEDLKKVDGFKSKRRSLAPLFLFFSHLSPLSPKTLSLPTPSAAELAAYKQKEKDRMFFLPSNATIPEPGNGTSQKTNPLGAIKQVIGEKEKEKRRRWWWRWCYRRRRRRRRCCCCFFCRLREQTRPPLCPSPAGCGPRGPEGITGCRIQR